ncbi:hypothetical protein B9Z55_007326 [Caenorhabditis nigoni]|uniref:Uncharacterized protein n=1 Tax=Caenorhabditis nigoni TaxID=1611254 RepID=A0A2G5V936_9PELO|nr:hypothetical protein B9Z55_007326 [Caenorhabditis nigoni]
MATAAHNRLVSEVQKRENDIEAKEMAHQKLMGNVLLYVKELAEKTAKIVELQSQLKIEQETQQGRESDLRKQIDDANQNHEKAMRRKDQMIEHIRQDHEAGMKNMEAQYREEIERRIKTEGKLEGELKCLRMAHQESQTNLEAEKRKVEDLQRREVNNRKRHSENLRKLWEDEENRLGIAGDEEIHKDEDSSGGTGEGTSHPVEERVEKQESRRKRRKAAQ